MAVEIALTSDGGQKFSTVIEGASYGFLVSYNARMEIWTCTISQNEVDIANGIVLLGGVDILNQYTFSLNNMYVVNIDNPTQDANGNNLGTDVRLFKLTDSEVLDLV